MLDIKLILENTDAIRESIQQRGAKADLDGLLALHAQRKALMLNVEHQRAESNQLAKKIPHV